MKFKAYPHIEKVGHLAVRDLEIGQVHVFPKIDGTNASLWSSDCDMTEAGSRKRTLSEEADNAGFCDWMLHNDDSEPYHALLIDYPNLRLYGEWLVPHTFKMYRDDCWRKFYVFDIYDHEIHSFIHFNDIVDLARIYNFKYIPALAIIDDPTEEQLINIMHTNNYLCKDGPGIIGEGIVLKRYDFRNEFGEVTWAKMVRAEFRDEHRDEMGVRISKGALTAERNAVGKYCTEAFVGKERAKIELALWNEFGEFPQEKYLCSRECRKKLIPRLLQSVFYELVQEHAWDFGGEPGNTIDFKKLRVMTISKVKEYCSDLF